MDVRSLGSVAGSQPLQNQFRQAYEAESAATSPLVSPQDEVSISADAMRLAEMSQSGDPSRLQKLQEVMRRLDSGFYDDDSILDQALSRMLVSEKL